MARTMQTARGVRSNTDDEVVSNPDIDGETEAKLKEIEKGDMRAEVKHIDRRFTDKGQVYYKETVEEEIPEQVNWWSKFALCIVRHLDGSNKFVQQVCLQVNSQHLKDILKAIVPQFPGISFQTKEISIQKPYRVLFHYRHELEAAGRGLNGEAAEHLQLLMDFINEEFGETIEESDNFVEQNLINYNHLWTIMRPGTMIYAPVFGQPRAFTLQSYQYVYGQFPGLNLQLEYVDFNGENCGTRTMCRLIPEFSGAEKICDLSAYPMSWHERRDEMKQRLIERGRRWESLAGMHFRTYKGIALEYTACGVSRYNVDGRVVVDAKTVSNSMAPTSAGNELIWVSSATDSMPIKHSTCQPSSLTRTRRSSGARFGRKTRTKKVLGELSTLFEQISPSLIHLRTNNVCLPVLWSEDSPSLKRGGLTSLSTI